jgi:peptide-methionine (S)-S-oxide reductase
MISAGADQCTLAPHSPFLQDHPMSSLSLRNVSIALVATLAALVQACGAAPARRAAAGPRAMRRVRPPRVADGRVRGRLLLGRRGGLSARQGRQSAVSGYAGGDAKTADYQTVSSGEPATPSRSR